MRSLSFRQVAFTLPVLGLCAVLAIPARADITLGPDARTVGMGGAGLASIEPSSAVTMNPASLADTGARLAVQWPSINARTDGAGFGDALKLLGKPSLSETDAYKLALSLGTQNTRLDTSANAGLLLPKMDLQVKAAIRTDIIPNEAFKQWASSGAEGVPSAEARADIHAGGIAILPSIGVGFRVPMNEEKTGRLAVGVRLKPTTAYYSHYVIDSAAVMANAPQLAPEMGGKSYLKEGSISADLGVTYSLPNMPTARVAVVVNNLIEPKAVSFATASPDGMFSKQLAPRTISAGAALSGEYVTLAADLVDLTRASGNNPQLRLGAEFRVPSTPFALRGGYSTSTGLTAGVGIGGFGIAYSKNTPIMLTQSITF